MSDFVVLVCGGRDYRNLYCIHTTLHDLHTKSRPITKIVHGSAKGADTYVGLWSKVFQIPYSSYPADWDKYGKAAGPIRNQQMLDSEKVDLVVAFPGGKGTANMISLARKAGIPVQIVEDQTTDCPK